MNAVRIWLDHHNIQPAFFSPVTHARSDVGFEIGFNTEDESYRFEREICVRA